VLLTIGACQKLSRKTGGVFDLLAMPGAADTLHACLLQEWDSMPGYRAPFADHECPATIGDRCSERGGFDNALQIDSQPSDDYFSLACALRSHCLARFDGPALA